VYALLLTGSRGPLLATAVATLAAMFLARERPPVSRSVPVIGISAVVLAQLFALAPAASQERLLTLLHLQVVDDTATRVELYQQAWHSFWVRPLGLGWGGFQELDVDGYPYPHDLPLEVLAEGGIVFGTLFLIWLGSNYVRARNLQAGFTGSAVFGVLTFALIESFVSGDLNDAKSLFFALGLGMALASPHCRTADVPWGDADGDQGIARGAPDGAAPRHDPAARGEEVPGRQRLRAGR
jgi:O-antigen ligase